MDKKTRFAVLGLGRFGESVARTLAGAGCDVLVCDIDAAKVKAAGDYAARAVRLDITDEKALRVVNIYEFDIVVLAVGANLEVSVLATVLLKEQGARYLLCTADNMPQKGILEKIGADRVVLPERETGARIATSLITQNVVEYVRISDLYGLAEMEPLSGWVGRTIKKANVRAESGLTIIAINRGGSMLVTPKPEEVIRADDLLTVIGGNGDIRRANARIREGGMPGGLFN